MTIKVYQVDAFTDTLFHGNPASVCILKTWLNKNLMQRIAMENNLSETAFVVQKNNTYHIRWFTPLTEVDLCGHATLATAHVLFNHLHYPYPEISFKTQHRGILKVRKDANYLIMDFPADHLKKATPPQGLIKSIGKKPQEIWKGTTDYLLVYKMEHDIRSITPNFQALSHVNARGIIITAPGDHCDFVSRFFAPSVGVNEDPVTGSAHTTLIPYWAQRLHKATLSAQQLSKRHGTLHCGFENNRVKISGKATTYLIGDLNLPQKTTPKNTLSKRYWKNDAYPLTKTPIPFHIIEWDHAPTTNHPGTTGNATWQTHQLPGLRIRIVRYSPGYLADHWCQKGHIVHCLKGEFTSELQNGQTIHLTKGQTYVVSDDQSSHRSKTDQGVTLLIIDGEFLQTPS
jgi:PhzF family phenazine biosynthesis protein